MASKAPFRSLVSAASSSLRPSPSLRRQFAESSACAFSTSVRSRTPEYEPEVEERPRWERTPARMVAPFRIRPQPQGPPFKVNEDPRKLDEVYIRMLGPDGDKMLSDEVKWLAVTHKSFDHGRRGFNDRLAFLGRRIVSLQTSLALINSPRTVSIPETDAFGRKPYTHPALDGLPSLTQQTQDSVLDISRLAALASRYGLDRVTRWKPRSTSDLKGSGIESVAASSLLSVIGAISLERGGEVANKIVQDRILEPLGFTFST